MSNGDRRGLDSGQFVDELLRVLAQASNVAGTGSMKTKDEADGAAQRNVKQRMADLIENPTLKVANARFALGADDGAYLRSNVMPLQTAEDDCDKSRLTARASFEIEAASRRGVLEALLVAQQERVQAAKGDSETIVETLAWLLSIREVAEFACAHLTVRVRAENAENAGNAEGGELARQRRQAAEDALEFAKDLRIETNAVTAQKSMVLNVNDPERNGDAVVVLLRVVLALFGSPRDAMNEQLKQTIGTVEEGPMVNLNSALDRLAISARFVRATLAADRVAAWHDPGAVTRALLGRTQSATESAVRLNAASNARVDFGGVHFQPAYDASTDFGHPSDAVITGARKTELVVQQMLGSASTGVSADELRPDVGGLDEPTFETLKRRIAGKRVELQEAQTAVAEATPGPGISPDEQQVAGLRRVEAIQAFRSSVLALLETDLRLAVAILAFVMGLDDVDAAAAAKFANDPATIAELQAKGLNPNAVSGDDDYAEVVQFRWSYNLALILEYDDIILGTPLETLQGGLTKLKAEVATPSMLSGMMSSTPTTRMGKYRALANEFDFLPDWRDLTAAVEQRNRARIAAFTAAIEATRAIEDHNAAAARAIETDNDQFLAAARDALLQPEEGQTPASGGLSFCNVTNYTAADNSDVTAIKNALTAGITQMREDSGFAVADIGGSLPRVERRAGISPFFTEPRQRPLDRTASGAVDWWYEKLWPEPIPPDNLQLAQLPERINEVYVEQRPTEPSELTDPGHMFVAYALARGLCGKRAPFHTPPSNDESLKYNLAQLPYPKASAATKDVKQDSAQALRDQMVFFGSRALPTYADFAEPLDHSQGEVASDAAVALWAPVRKSFTGDKGMITPSFGTDAQHVSESVVLEHLVDHFKRLADTMDEDRMRILALGAAAYTKVHQLPSLCNVFPSPAGICNPHPTVNNERYTFFTRPVVRCSGKPVLYPCDAGLASYVSTSNDGTNTPQTQSDTSLLSKDSVQGAITSDGKRAVVPRARATSYMRSLLAQSPGGDPQETVSEGRAAAVPLCVAAVPGSTADEIAYIIENTTPSESMQASENSPKKIPNTQNLPKGNDKSIQPEQLEAALRNALHKCNLLKTYSDESDAIRRRLKEIKDSGDPPPPPDDDVARVRREAVWNDAKREACISGDRLYAFARQFAGTISEQVDSICLIDEGMLVRQQQDQRVARQRLVDRAAQEHMAMVRSVFTAVLKESGLTLGIETQGSIGELKVVSNSLRKQASELASGGSSSEGYFANSVRLENLLASGTGELTLADLFQRLGDAGKALQQAALSSQTADAVQGASLDFLSAPRNSLLLRWKPESLAAVRHAFDLFQREMLNLHGPTYRTISAYELIEGCDDALCCAFAQFCAHCLVHSRMFSSSNSMYLSAWPAAANATQMKVSLRRLVNLARDYLVATPNPSFLSPDGRANYFTCAGSRRGGFGLPTVVGREVLPPGGLWMQNFYQ